ncbi:hypothetical protein [Fodinibius sp. Rm-B-1B1-1]|uniref:hypothetical protein n=1 Tax=Fodinibius alkaliphilus TaxID=3140241 RepID=UPI003159CC58
MKKHLVLLLVIAFGIQISNNVLQAQSIELLGSSTLNGAMNGVLLGGATMALQNSNEYRPVEVGLGTGTLVGIGMGAYDMSQVSQGQQFYISGTFNDGTNRSILVLLDTIYGAAGGMVVGSSITLIAKERIAKGLQYGAGTGAWLGFGFGLFDAFVLSQRPANLRASLRRSSHSVGGVISYSNAHKSVEVGLINPQIIEQKELSANKFQKSYQPAINVVELQVNL